MATGSGQQRFLFVANHLSWGGAEAQLHTLASELSSRGRGTTLVSIGPAGGSADALQAAGVNVIILGAIGRAGKLRALARLIGLARDADVVHCTGWDASLWGRLAAVAARTPAVVTEHSGDRDFQFSAKGAPRARMIELHNRVLDRATAAYVVVARKQIRILEEEGVRPSSVVYIPNGVRVEKLRCEAAQGPGRDALGIPGNALVVAQVARFVPLKGQSRTLRAVCSLRGSQGDVRAVFAGDGPLEEDVRQEAHRMGADWATFLGYRADVGHVMSIADVVVLPSAAEGLPVSLLEAMAVGRPVVATDVGDVGWLLRSTEAGIAVAPGDEDAFCRALERVLADRKLRHDLAASAFRAAPSFDSERMALQYEQVLAAAAAREPIPRVDV